MWLYFRTTYEYIARIIHVLITWEHLCKPKLKRRIFWLHLYVKLLYQLVRTCEKYLDVWKNCNFFMELLKRSCFIRAEKLGRKCLKGSGVHVERSHQAAQLRASKAIFIHNRWRESCFKNREEQPVW